MNLEHGISEFFKYLMGQLQEHHKDRVSEADQLAGTIQQMIDEELPEEKKGVVICALCEVLGAQIVRVAIKRDMISVEGVDNGVDVVRNAVADFAAYEARHLEREGYALVVRWPKDPRPAEPVKDAAGQSGTDETTFAGVKSGTEG